MSTAQPVCDCGWPGNGNSIPKNDCPVHGVGGSDPYWVNIEDLVAAKRRDNSHRQGALTALRELREKANELYEDNNIYIIRDVIDTEIEKYQ